MAESKIAKSLGKIITNSANLLGRVQAGIDVVLWGRGQVQSKQTASYDPKTGNINYQTNITSDLTPPKRGIFSKGVFGVLDALNAVDLCNILTYAVDNIQFKKKPRPAKEEWTAAQTALYALQDTCGFVVTQIDKFTAYPNVFIGSYVGLGPNALPQNEAIAKTDAPAEGGTDVQKYNLYFLLKSIKETFSFNSPNSLFTAEDQTLLTTVPGLGGNLNFIDDFLGIVEKYSDYRQIPNDELQKLVNKVNKVRSVCVTIQNLDFKDALSAIGNFTNGSIRQQIQDLNKFVDVTQVLPTLRQVNASIRSFIKQANQIQGILTTGQFLIKLALLFYKIFRFIISFFSALVIPLIFSTSGAQTNIQDLKDKAKNEADGVVRFLNTLNALLSVVVSTIRYILANTNELLFRLDILLKNLEACEAVKDSDVIAELRGTRAQLLDLRDQLSSIITLYDSKTDPDQALFGDFQIRVVDEELADNAIVNRRRRGIALDKNGNIAAQSDLTFATNTGLIIAETQQKLLALGLVQPGLGTIDTVNLAIVSESLNYLDNEDILQNDLNISPSALDSADNLDENKGLGLNAFINNLKGGKKLRQRTRAAVASQSANTRSQIQTEFNASKQTLKTSS